MGGLNKKESVSDKNEQIKMVKGLQTEKSSVIHGVVVGENRCAVKDAVVKLFIVPNRENCCELIPVTHTFTDELGQFSFEPLIPGTHYIIKVWHAEVKIRSISS